MEQIKILFLTATPTDHPRPDVEAEFKHIEAELDRSTQSDRFDLRFVPAVDRAYLLRQLQKVKPHIVHFSGHGSDRDEIILESATGAFEAVSAEELEMIFKLVPQPDRPNVVVLSACYSEAQANAVTRVVNCAIGMTQEIKDSQAFAFDKGFYLAVGQGYPIDEAVEFGRLAMEGGEDVRKLPRLHLRAGTSAATISFVDVGPVSRFPSDLHIDRNDQLECFRRMIHDGEPRVLILTAATNMGKSELIKVMARVAGGNPVAMTDLTKVTGTPEMVIDRLASGLGIGAVPAFAVAPALMTASTTDLGPDPHAVASRQKELAQRTETLVQAAQDAAQKQERPAVLLIDGFNTSDSNVGHWVEEALLPAVLKAEGIVCVVAGQETPDVYQSLHLVRYERLENFDENDLRDGLRGLGLDTSANVVRQSWLVTENGNPYLAVEHLRVLWKDARRAAL
jgi:hypothetical protein